MSEIRVGDRVRLTPEYWKWFRKIASSKPDRLGKVVGVTRFSLRVVWDGTSDKTIQYYDPRFLERVDERDFVL